MLFVWGTYFVYTVVVIVTLLFCYYKWSFQYWRKKNVPYIEPDIPFGNCRNAIQGKENLALATANFYNVMKQNGWKHGGLYVFTVPVYLPVSLECLKNILTKDFQYFTDRADYYHKSDVLSILSLLQSKGARWRHLRTKLTPIFTSNKVKMMFQTLIDCQYYLLEKMKEQSIENKPIDIKENLARFTTDIIGSCGFGLNFKSFEDENSPFRKYGRKLFNLTKAERLKRTLGTLFPTLASYLNISIIPEDIARFFKKIVKDTVDYREKNNLVRNDFLEFFMNLNRNNDLSFEEVAAQSFIFFAAGFETSSTLMTFALYELSRNQTIQEKVRDEIKTVLAKHDAKLTYDSLQELKYLEQVIDETLRKYPPLPLMTRRCVKDYKIPDENVTIEKGTMVFIPILGVQHDEDYYPNPTEFDPERFSEKNKSTIPNHAYLPFGEGPRLCIGKRFGIMSAKIGLSCLVQNFKFTVNQKTQEPLQMQVSPLFMAAEGEIWLDAEKININI